MKNVNLLFNIVLLVLVGVLFYLHFSTTKTKTPAVASKSTDAQPMAATNDCKIAYFEMDSIENTFSMVKDVKAELSRKEEAINNELTRMQRNYQQKASDYQSKAATMNQVQSEMATKDIMQMQQNMQNRKQQLDEEYQNFYMRRMRDVKTKIEDFLKGYNNDKGFAYIFAYEPGLFYYRDTAFNITNDVIKGLNETYTTKK